MRHIYARPRKYDPNAAYYYIDKVHVWLTERLNRSRQRQIQKQCDGPLHTEDRLAGFDPSYVQRLTLHQPNPKAFVTLAALKDVHLNCVELACDGVFAGEHGEREARSAARIIGLYQIQPRHRGEIKIVEGTRYTGYRWRNAAIFAQYADRPSKVTGELGCCHVELRLYGKRALKRRGVSSVSDLLRLDERAIYSIFLKEFLVVDPQKLGLIYHNHLSKPRQRLREPQTLKSRSFIFHLHSRIGSLLMRGSGSMQELIHDRRLPPKVQARIMACCYRAAPPPTSL